MATNIDNSSMEIAVFFSTFLSLIFNVSSTLVVSNTFSNFAMPLIFFKKKRSLLATARFFLLQAKYIPAQCTNVILQVGFGPGSLIIQGHIAMSASFMFPFDMGRSPYYFQRNNIESQITFEWFKLVVISMDRSWVTQWNQSEAGMARIPVNIRDHPELLRIIRSRHDVTNEHTRGLEK